MMKEGHTFTIEPVVTEGSTLFKILADNWTARASDLGLVVHSAHYSHHWVFKSAHCTHEIRDSIAQSAATQY